MKKPLHLSPLALLTLLAGCAAGEEETNAADAALEPALAQSLPFNGWLPNSGSASGCGDLVHPFPDSDEPPILGSMCVTSLDAGTSKVTVTVKDETVLDAVAVRSTWLQPAEFDCNHSIEDPLTCEEKHGTRRFVKYVAGDVTIVLARPTSTLFDFEVRTTIGGQRFAVRPRR